MEMPAMYVLLFYLYTVSSGMSGLITSAEYTTLARCEAAAQAAKKKFESPMLKGYYICAEK